MSLLLPSLFPDALPALLQAVAIAGGVSMGAMAIAPSPADAGAEEVTVTGVYVQRGTGVECFKVRTDAGRLVGVLYIPTNFKIGDRLTMRGTFGPTLKCRGKVLKPRSVERS